MTPSVPTAERVLLGIFLCMAGPLLALATGVLLVPTGIEERLFALLGNAAMVSGLVASAVVAPRLFANAGRYSLLHRVLTGVLGLGAAAVAGKVISALGINGEALSHQPSPWAFAQEGMAVAAFYGSMILTAFLVLGASSGSESPRAAEQADEADARPR